MSRQVLRAMPEEDWRRLESLAMALRNVSGGGGITARLVPGVGLVVSGASSRGRSRRGETWAMVRLTVDG